MGLIKMLDDFKSRFCSIPNSDRRAKIGSRDFVSVLVFCFTRDRGDVRTLDCMRKFVESKMGLTISRAAFCTSSYHPTF